MSAGAATGAAGPRPPAPRLLDALAWLALGLAALAICWPLGLTNRILTGIDAFTYFLPYWDYRMAALRAGDLPLWNPYLFLGAPFLANPQAAVLYPPHWSLSWLTPEQALNWSAILHVWLAAGFTYTLGRRSFGLTRLAAWLGGLVFGLSGFALARVENINQLNALAWLPALLWLHDETAHALARPEDPAARRAARWRQSLRWGAALSVVIALQILAGHTQTTFINLVGLGLYAVARLGWRRPRGADLQRGLAPLLAVIPALLLSAAQLLPTLELNGLGLRTGGLPFRQAVSFSLRPRLLAQTFLPPFGGGLAEAFASEGYAEFAGYTGIVALALAAVALRRAWRRRGADDAPRARGPVALAAAGVFLALGAYNPVYYLLWRFVPGFDLFRAPARWLAFFALGVAVLAGAGLDALRAAGEGRGGMRTSADPARPPRPPARPRILSRKWLWAGLILLIAAGLTVIQQPPPWPTLAGWLAVAGLSAGLLWSARRRPDAARGGLVLLALLELWVAGRALPFAQATAPLASGLRNAPAALLAATADQPPAGRDRFLSLSDIRFDPGDLAELRELQADRLPPEAVERLVRAAKQVEVIAPNLPLRYRLPAVDGYDGGLLPLGRYVELQSLFLPADQLIPDGRLREQLPAVPADRLLDLTHVRFVITDKQRDLWADDIYYDLELPAPLDPGATLTLDLAGYPRFAATALGVVAEAHGPTAAGAPLAEVAVVAAEGSTQTLRLEAGPRTGADPAPVRLALPRPLTATRLTIHAAGQGAGVTIHGLSLIDERTGAHTTVTVSPRGDFRRIHTGDVKIYQRTGTAGRARIVHGIRPVADDAAALAALADPAFDPRASAVIAADIAAAAPASAGARERADIVAASAERVELRAQLASPGLLVLADTFYPGWEATVDGRPAPILRANLLFRAVALAPGAHEVVFTYRPRAWQLGAWISLGTLAFLSALLGITYIRQKPG